MSGLSRFSLPMMTSDLTASMRRHNSSFLVHILRMFMVTIIKLFALDCCRLLDDNEKSSGVGEGVLPIDFTEEAREISEHSFTESNRQAERFYRPQLGHFDGYEDVSNVMRRIVSMLRQTV